MLDKTYSLKHQQKLMILYLHVTLYQKKNVKDKSPIFMNSNSTLKLPNSILKKSLKIANQSLLKNIPFLVGSNGKPFKKPPQILGSLHSD